MDTKKIEIKVKDCKTKSLDQFQEFQGELKKISPENLKRLKQSIVGGGLYSAIIYLARQNPRWPSEKNCLGVTALRWL